MSPTSAAAALLRPASGAVASAPPTLPPEAPLGQALAAMAEARASSVLAVDAAGRPVGILTEQDVARRVAFRMPPEAPLAAAMTTPVIGCAAERGLWRAVALLRAHRLRHLPLLDRDGSCIGMLHRADALEASSGLVLAHLDALAGDDAAVKQAQAGLATALLAEGLDAAEVVALVSGINADLHRRILDRAIAAEAEPPPVAFTLLLMGSLGRGESLLRPDQDNGFLLADYADADHGRVDAWFRRVSERFCLALDEAGFTLCKGGVMAMNPLWRKTRTQWRDQLRLWARKRHGAALLFADIFLDLRAGWGEEAPVEALREQAMALLKEEQAWGAMLATQDAQLNVGLTFWGGFADDEPGPGARTDLKLHGLMPLVAAARLAALRAGVGDPATPARLAGLAARGTISNAEAERLRAGFAVLLDAVLRQQLAGSRRRPAAREPGGHRGAAAGAARGAEGSAEGDPRLLPDRGRRTDRAGVVRRRDRRSEVLRVLGDALRHAGALRQLGQVQDAARRGAGEQRHPQRRRRPRIAERPVAVLDHQPGPAAQPIERDVGLARVEPAGQQHRAQGGVRQARRAALGGGGKRGQVEGGVVCHQHRAGGEVPEGGQRLRHGRRAGDHGVGDAVIAGGGGRDPAAGVGERVEAARLRTVLQPHRADLHDGVIEARPEPGCFEVEDNVALRIQRAAWQRFGRRRGLDPRQNEDGPPGLPDTSRHAAEDGTLGCNGGSGQRRRRAREDGQ
ncbi:MAG TPA: DUF294 nucleotidyltransferase-like domain-containing protein [Falsiroseomonas sp.]|jgi:signal-transduction protein with cAMP-binding, CBS, and nucleotidyltransferase domain|nr:DUF294 nucleotidyltransferase-like domain-containing protein [Falsiroseomonas sp.]